MFLSGEICSACDVCSVCTRDQIGDWLIKGSGRPEMLSARTSEECSERQSGIAREGAISFVTGQKSAEAIVGEVITDDNLPKGRTCVNKEES